MEVHGTATICISTPLGKHNFYSELADARDDRGRRVFNVLHIKGSRPPPWKTQSSRSRIKAIYGERSTLYKREILGEIADDSENAAFNHRQLERAFSRPVLAPPYEIQDNRVFVALDPNGGASSSGGPGSDTAIVSFVVSAGRLVIVGLDSAPTPGPEQARRLLYAHVAALQKQPLFAACRFMMILEANLGNEAQHCANYMLHRNPGNVDILCSRSHCYGVFTDPFDKERYVHSFQDRLALDGLFFHNNLVCAARQNQQQTRAQVLEKTLNEFKRQLFAFRAIHIVPNSLSARVRVIYSGKADKDGKRSRRLKDDMCMALLFGFFYCLRLNGPYKLVNTRDSRSMLEIDPVTGAPLEGAPPFAIEHAVAQAAKRSRMRTTANAGE